MKKILSTVAALGLVVGMSATASALDWSVSGHYVVQGVNLNHVSSSNTIPTPLTLVDPTYSQSNGLAGTRAGDFNDGQFVGPDDKQNSDAYYWHEFIVDVTMAVNDNIKMKSEIRMIDKYSVWEDTDTENGNYVNVHKIWMEYTNPHGVLKIGRMSSGPFKTTFLDDDDHADQIQLHPALPEPFSAYLLTMKYDEDDSIVAGYNNTDETDGDYDIHKLKVGYNTDKLNINTRFLYYDDATNKDLVVNAFDRAYWAWDQHVKITSGNMYLEGELQYLFGNWMEWEDAASGDDIDIDALALMLDAGAKLGDLDVGLMYFFMQGQDDDDDMTAHMTQSKGVGGDFQPYYVLTGPQAGMLNEDLIGGGYIDAEMSVAGAHCLGVYADFQVSPKLTVHGALAYAWADETETLQTEDENGNVDDRDDSYGWELDVGVAYKLLDNLTYQLNIGYLDTGDFFAVAYDGLGNGYETDDTNNIVLVTNTLSMQF